MGITINEGTATEVYAKNCSGTEVQIVKLDVGSGTALSDWGGTVASNLYTLIAGEDQTNDVMKGEQQFNYSHYTIGSGTVKSAAGFLHSITVNTLATAPIEIFDAVGTAAGTVATLKASAAEQTYFYDVKCTTGITIASTTAAACDVTVSYR